MSYTEHLLPSSSSLKNKEVPIYLDGGKTEGSGSSFLKSFMAVIVALEHGTCLCLVVQLANLLVSESYQFHVSLYFFVPVEDCSYFMSHYVLGTRQVNASKSVFVPHHVQGNFNFKPSICCITNFCFLCQSILI
jgi:hypothetical protein